jgi:membrane protein DedA with SNARE-associated domain
MNFTSFSVAFAWVIAHGYILMFVGMVIEGPIITAAAAFAAAAGYFSLPVVLALSLLGDLVADILYYTIGYWSRGAFVEKYGHHLGLSKERIARIENFTSKHPIKTLVALKINPITPMPGLMLVGATKMPLKRFAVISLAITLPKSILFVIIGYYFGKSYDSLAHYVNYGYASLIAIGIILIIFYAYRKISSRIANKIERLD